ncbi:MAG: hypothetical protein KKF85_06830 [Gammaproteobacteria bacterium]|nr:hypothetical protein [Gammaproteobacteria bacterium]MBU3989843.1 hypothetical protein [Gammaproteobacteria bacterium]MBU4004371.1 hypothetical protein [Gammaproteobacteria bacterium]MBU4019780.1 hypothetical protein [Gammaproteobacteria bacterium]MBU4097399.1 hypothetical protein [Gammaproteobacteria bacterium]
MHNSPAQTRREFAIRQGAMGRFYGKAGTGSVIDEAQSASYQAALCDWDLLNPVAIHSQGLHAATGAFFVVIKNRIALSEIPEALEPNPNVSLPTVALSPSSVLDGVRAVFGLNISETAEICGITRQTAYQWMKLTDMEQVRAHENRDRIKQVYSAAQAWYSHPPLKGRWLHALLPAGNTVFDLLKAPKIDLDAMQAAYQALAVTTTERRREEGERATRAATALAGAFAGLGSGRKSRKG